MSYKIVWLPFLALIITQIIKIIIDAKHNKFSWKDFNSYGGMPSAHSAMVTALVFEMGQLTGFYSPYTAISAVFAFLMIRDAVGIRFKLGKHAKILNMLIQDLPDYKEDKYPYLEERLGHTYLQAGVGMIVGVLTSLIF